MKKEQDTFIDSSEGEGRAAETVEQEKKQSTEVMDFEDLKKLAGLEDIEDLQVKIVNLQQQVDLLVVRSGEHHDLRHIVLHWVAGATAAMAVISFDSIREHVMAGGLHIPDAVLRALEALATNPPL